MEKEKELPTGRFPDWAELFGFCFSEDQREDWDLFRPSLDLKDTMTKETVDHFKRINNNTVWGGNEPLWESSPLLYFI